MGRTGRAVAMVAGVAVGSWVLGRNWRATLLATVVMGLFAVAVVWMKREK